MNTPKKILMRFVMTALVIALLATTVGTTLAANGSYTVQPGDSLTKIARLYNTTVAALVDANKVQFPCLATNAACLQVGWVITVPGGPVATGTTATTTTNPGT